MGAALDHSIAQPQHLASGVSEPRAHTMNTIGVTMKPDGTPITGQNPFYGWPPLLLADGGSAFEDGELATRGVDRSRHLLRPCSVDAEILLKWRKRTRPNR